MGALNHSSRGSYGSRFRGIGGQVLGIGAYSDRTRCLPCTLSRKILTTYSVAGWSWLASFPSKRYDFSVSCVHQSRMDSKPNGDQGSAPPPKGNQSLCSDAGPCLAGLGHGGAAIRGRRPVTGIGIHENGECFALFRIGTNCSDSGHPRSNRG